MRGIQILGHRGIPTLARGGDGFLQYWQKVKNLFGANLIAYWPLWDAAGAAAADDIIGSNDGTPTEVTFGVTGIGDNRTAASFNGTASRIDCLSAGLAAAFSATEGFIHAYAKVSGAGVWTDGVARNIVEFGANDNNRISIRRSLINGRLTLSFVGGGTAKTTNLDGLAPTDWFPVGVSWSTSGNVVDHYMYGVEVSGALTMPEWSGALAKVWIGSYSAASNYWSGSIAHVTLGNRFATAAEMAVLANP